MLNMNGKKRILTLFLIIRKKKTIQLFTIKLKVSYNSLIFFKEYSSVMGFNSSNDFSAFVCDDSFIAVVRFDVMYHTKDQYR